MVTGSAKLPEPFGRRAQRQCKRGDVKAMSIGGHRARSRGGLLLVAVCLLAACGDGSTAVGSDGSGGSGPRELEPACLAGPDLPTTLPRCEEGVTGAAGEGVARTCDVNGSSCYALHYTGNPCSQPPLLEVVTCCNGTWHGADACMDEDAGRD